MTEPNHQLLAVRQAVRRTPAYPFTARQGDVKLDQNENPENFPSELRALALERLAARPWNRYPDLHAERLSEKIAAFEDWDPRGVVVHASSSALIKTLVEMSGIGQSVITTNPIFSVYDLESELLGARAVHVPLNEDFSLPVAGLQAALRDGEGGLLVLTEPHAPSGYLDPVADVRAVLESASDRYITVLDEAYHEYAGSDLRELVRGRPQALSLRTFSKAWGLAGLRVGYALTSAELATELRKVVSAFAVNVLSESVLEVALEHPEYVAERVERAIQERERIRAALQGHPRLEVLPSWGNFFLLRAEDAGQVFEHLLSRGILVRPQGGRLAGYLRVSLGTPAENDRLIEALREA